jgi:hypothetical protein
MRRMIFVNAPVTGLLISAGKGSAAYAISGVEKAS